MIGSSYMYNRGLVPSKRARPDGASWSWRRRDVRSGRFKGRPQLVVCRSVRSCNGGYDGNYTVLPGFCQGNFGNSCSLHARGEHGLGSPVWQGLPGQPHFCSLQTGGHDGLWSPVSLQPATHVWLKSVHNYCLQGSKKTDCLQGCHTLHAARCWYGHVCFLWDVWLTRDQ